MVRYSFYVCWLVSALSFSCKRPSEVSVESKSVLFGTSRGWIIPIGGGPRTEKLLTDLIDFCHLQQGDTLLIAPMASEEPDSAFINVARDFGAFGLVCRQYFFTSADQYIPPTETGAKLIFFTGGDQSKLMQALSLPGVIDDLKEFVQSGGHIVGTSAGAAVLSSHMITGNQRKHPQYESTFSRLRVDNVELTNGLGFISKAVVDQHFVARSRYNRLFSVLYELPNLQGIGVEESTGMVTDDSIAIAIGSGQVVQIIPGQPRRNGDLIGFHHCIVNIHLPGDTFSLISK